MTYIIYLMQNIGQVDLFSTVLKQFYTGMDESNTPIAGNHIVKCSHTNPLRLELEEL